MARPKLPHVYTIASSKHGMGVTADLPSRMQQHREDLIPGFSSRYGVTRLVRHEFLEDMPTAIARERQLEKWRRDRKLRLIEEDNPAWIDLAIGLGFGPVSASAVRMDPRLRGDDGIAGSQ